MELSNDLVIELALNVIGYLAAGGLTLVLCSLIRRRQGVVPRSDSGESGVVSAGGRNVDGSCGPTHGMEIIMFDDRTPASAEPNRPDQAITSPGRQPAGITVRPKPVTLCILNIFSSFFGRYFTFFDYPGQIPQQVFPRYITLQLPRIHF